LFLGQESLDSESLVRGHGEKSGQMHAFACPRWWAIAEEAIFPILLPWLFSIS
jgi:hypothetical protein